MIVAAGVFTPLGCEPLQILLALEGNFKHPFACTTTTITQEASILALANKKTTMTEICYTKHNMNKIRFFADNENIYS